MQASHPKPSHNPQQRAPPPPPRPVQIATNVALKHSTLAWQPAHLFRNVAGQGVGQRIPPTPDLAQQGRDALAIAMQHVLSRGQCVSQANAHTAYGVFDHIGQQEELFRSICKSSVGISTFGARARRGGPAAPSRYSSSSSGLLVDTGAVRPFIGGAFVESQTKEMQKHWFQVHWSDLAVLEYMCAG